MLNLNAKLVDNLLDTKNIQMVPTRDGFGKGLVEYVDAQQFKQAAAQERLE